MSIPEPILDVDAQLLCAEYQYVYAWQRGEAILYVGCSSQGVRRVVMHNRIGKVEPLQAQDRILFWKFPDWPTAAAFEMELIAAHKPPYNSVGRMQPDVCRQVVCPTCKTTFMQTRWWQMFCSRRCRGSTHA